MSRANSHNLATPAPSALPRPAAIAAEVPVNDVHSRLNSTSVGGVTAVRSAAELGAAIQRCAREGRPVALAGGRNAMGGQAFLSGAELLDTRPMKQVLEFNPLERWIEVEAGIQWPELVDVIRSLDCRALEAGAGPLGIVQKQTGADRMTLGGSLSANVHGRGLALAPIGQQVLALTLVDARGDFVRCSRTENGELFRLVLGGYGLFGAIVSVRLQLAPRRSLRRHVVLGTTEHLMEAFQERIEQGYRFGDFQFAVDPDSEDFLYRGVFSCYRNAEEGAAPQAGQRTLSADQWERLIQMAHVDKSRAFDEYCAHYLATDGQLYASDTHQLATYLDGYHKKIDAQLGHVGTEVICEVHLPRHCFAEFTRDARTLLRATRADVIYGTVRLIERDEDSFLAWAREDWACMVLNLHVRHEPKSVEAAQEQARGLYDLALACGGSFYLTYHLWATAEQLLRAHPRLPAFLEAKRAFDPQGRFQSDWLSRLQAILQPHM